MLRDELRKSGLTRREAEIVEYVNRGLSNREVAHETFITEKTVKFHLTNVFQKLGLKSRAQLIVWCTPRLSFEEKGEAQAVTSEPQEIIPAGSRTVSGPKISR